jgi:hypothetical protein
MGASGCLTVIAVVFLLYGISTVQENPAILIAVLVVAGFGFAWAMIIRKQTKVDDLRRLENMANQLVKFADKIGKLEIPGFSPEKGEIPIYKLQSAALTEYRSTGSSYQGGSQGVSFRIAKGVSYRVGSSRGQLVKNPEQLTVIDEGSVTFTNKRIVFVGSNVNREWEFSKLLDVTVGSNGVFVNLAVSNRQKNSGLQTTDKTEITPGILASIALEAFEKDIQAAKAVAIQYSDEMKSLVSSSSKQVEGKN